MYILFKYIQYIHIYIYLVVVLFRYVLILFNDEKDLPDGVVETGSVAKICNNMYIFGYILLQIRGVISKLSMGCKIFYQSLT